MLDKEVIIRDFFYFIEQYFIEVLTYLSNGESWQSNVIGYELPKDGDFESGILIFMDTSDYGEVLISDLEFYNNLKTTCDIYIKNYLDSKSLIQNLLSKIKINLNLKE